MFFKLPFSTIIVNLEFRIVDCVAKLGILVVVIVEYSWKALLDANGTAFFHRVFLRSVACHRVAAHSQAITWANIPTIFGIGGQYLNLVIILHIY